MKETKLGSDINPDDKVCYNCKHLAWAIGVGQGLRCIHPRTGNSSEMIPSSKHTCNDFEKNPRLDKPSTDEFDVKEKVKDLMKNNMKLKKL